MILISFPALKASINCLKKSIEPVLMLCESLNDVLTLHWFTADREIEWERNTHTQYRCSCLQQSYWYVCLFSECLALFVLRPTQIGLSACIFMGERNEKIYWEKHMHMRKCSTNIQMLNSPEFDLIWFKLLRFSAIRLNSKHCLPSTTTWRAVHCCFRELGEWMNELKLSPTLPLGPQVISWSNVTFVESVMCVCERLCVCVCVQLWFCACCFYKPQDKTEVTWGLLWGLSSLPFINAGGHSHCTVGHLLCAMNSKHKHTDYNTESCQRSNKLFGPSLIIES